MPFDKSIPFLASPNFSDRGGKDITGIIVHYTAGLHSIGWMQNPLSQASAHFLIDRAGTITQMVECEKAAWHAGKAMMDYRGAPNNDPNKFTIGIELENLGLMVPGRDGKFMVEVGNNLLPYGGKFMPIKADYLWPMGHQISGSWEPYYEDQYKALDRLMDLLLTRYKDARGNVKGHDEIAVPMGRKTDPGPLFDWSRYGRRSMCQPIFTPPKVA